MNTELKEALDGLAQATVERLESHERQLTEIAQRMEVAPISSVRGQKADPFAKLADDQSVVAVRNRQSKSAIITLEGGIGLLTKSTVVGDTAGSSESGFDVQPQRMPGLFNDPRRQGSLLDVLPRVAVTSNTFEFNKLDGYTNAAAAQASEGAAKAEASLPTVLDSVSITTIAHWIKASTQVLADAPQLSQQMQSLLRYGVQAKLESEIVAGDGTSGRIAGLTDVGNFTAFAATSGEALADTIGRAIAQLDANGWRAGLIVMHPNTWHEIRSERTATEGDYVAGGWNNPAPPNVWGVPVVTNAAMAEGDVLVLDPQQVLILDRMQATAEFGYVNDDFTKNVVTLRAELRAGLAVLAPSAVLLI